MDPLRISKPRVWARALTLLGAFLVVLAIPSVAWLHERYLGETLLCATLVPSAALEAATGIAVSSTRSGEDERGCRTYFDDRDAREIASVAITTYGACDPLAYGGQPVAEVASPVRASERGGTYVLALELPAGCAEVRIGNGVARIERARVVEVAAGIAERAPAVTEYLVGRAR